MTLEEAFTIGVIAVLATAATAAIYLGLLNWMAPSLSSDARPAII